MAPPLELIAFDLDGVVADTEPLHRNAKLRIFKEFGLENSVDLDKHVGRPNSELWTAIIRENDLTRSPKEFEALQYEYILEEMREKRTPLSEGLASLLAALEERGVRCGVCSSSDRSYVDRVLQFYGLADRFSPVVAGDQVAAKKPAPDGYLQLLAEAGVAAESAVAIEDSQAGAAAATAAGLRCIGYVNPTSGNQDLSAAFMRVASLGAIAEWVGK